MKACLLIPIFDHGRTIRDVLAALEPAGLTCLVIDDGSGRATRAVLDALPAEFPWVEVHHRLTNGGKGAALRTGFRLAAWRGFTHAIHLDADGQHAAEDLPRFVAAMEERPEALVLGNPIFDASAPRLRRAARQLSRGLVWLATLSTIVRDPLCGFRGVPLTPTLPILDRVRTGDHMEFEPELAVRLVWEGVPVVDVPTRVVYPEGGISHFRLVRDDLRLAGLYLRLVLGMLVRAPRLLWRRR